MPSDAAEEHATGPSAVTTLVPARILRRKKKRNLSLSHSADFQSSQPSRRKRSRTEPHSPQMACETRSSAKGKERAHPPPGDLVGPKVNGGIQEARGSLVVPYRAPSPCDSVASSRHTDEVDAVQVPSEESLEIQRLQKELSLKNEIIHKQQSTLQSLQNILQCQICLELLWKPFLLSPCGHVLCESCLKSWFTSSQQGAPVLLAPQHREKTCPCCRAKIRTRPVAIYLVKSIVFSLTPSLDPSTFSRPSPAYEPNPSGGNPNNEPLQDPWDGIFPAPHGIHALADHPGLIIDEQDGGVLRCAECLHEIFDGQCTGCGRMYDDAVAETASDDNLYPFLTHSDAENYESDVSFDAYEDSFIDDDEDEEGGESGRAAHGSSRGEVDADEAVDNGAFYDAQDGVDSEVSSAPFITNHRARRAVPIQDNNESEEVFHDAQSTILEDETDGASRSAPERAQQTRPSDQESSSRHRRDVRVSSPIVVRDTDSDSEDSDERWSRGFYTPGGGYVRRLPMPRMRLDGRGRVVFDSTDEDDDGNGEAVLGSDRNFSSRRPSGVSSPRRSGTSHRARVILSISPSVSGSESEEALAHRVAGLERDTYGEDDFVVQPPRQTRRRRPTHGDDDEEEEVGDGLSSLEEASSGHSRSDGFLSDSDDHGHHGHVDDGHYSDSHDGEEDADER